MSNRMYPANPVNVGDKVIPLKDIMMPDCKYPSVITKVGTPEALRNEPVKFQDGDWVILDGRGGWLPRWKFEKF